MNTARQHTDGVDSTDTTRIIKPIGRTEAALREAGHREPVLGHVSDADWNELESQLAYLRGESRPVCRGCDGPLLPNQPEGAYCKRCAEEMASLEYADNTQEIRLVGFFIVGIAVGVPLTVLVLKWVGWLP